MDIGFGLLVLNCLSLTDAVENCNSGLVLNSQEKPHGANSHKSKEYENKVLSHLPKKSAVRWPRMGDVSRWKDFEDQFASEIPA